MFEFLLFVLLNSEKSSSHIELNRYTTWKECQEKKILLDDFADRNFLSEDAYQQVEMVILRLRELENYNTDKTILDKMVDENFYRELLTLFSRWDRLDKEYWSDLIRFRSYVNEIDFNFTEMFNKYPEAKTAIEFMQKELGLLKEYVATWEFLEMSIDEFSGWKDPTYGCVAVIKD